MIENKARRRSVQGSGKARSTPRAPTCAWPSSQGASLLPGRCRNRIRKCKKQCLAMQGLGELCPSRSSLFLLTSLSCLGSVDLHAKRCNFERGPKREEKGVPLVFDPDAAERCQLVTVKPQKCERKQRTEGKQATWLCLLNGIQCPYAMPCGPHQWEKAFPKQRNNSPKATPGGVGGHPGARPAFGCCGR